MRRPAARMALVGLMLMVLPLLTAERCQWDPAHIQVTSIVLMDKAGFAVRSEAGGADSLPRSRPGTTSVAGVFRVPANEPGSLLVTFTSDTTFTTCVLDLNGRADRPVEAVSPSTFRVTVPTGPLTAYRTISGSLICTPTAGVTEPAVSNFTVATQPWPHLVASPAKVDVGNIIIGSTSDSHRVTITNDGDSAAVFEYLTGSYPEGVNVAASIRNHSIVHKGASFTITVSYTPKAPELLSGVVGAVFDANRLATLFTVTGRSGTARSPVFAASTNWLKFPAVSAGSTQSQSFTITNNGILALHVGWLQVTGNNPDQFGVDTETCTAAPIEPGTTCKVTIRFQPNAGGYRNAVLRIGDDASGNPHEVTLTGDGIAPTPTEAPPYVPPGPP